MEPNIFRMLFSIKNKKKIWCCKPPVPLKGQKKKYWHQGVPCIHWSFFTGIFVKIPVKNDQHIQGTPCWTRLISDFNWGHITYNFYDVIFGLFRKNVKTPETHWPHFVANRRKKSCWFFFFFFRLIQLLQAASKGQTISEWIYEVIVSPKIRTKHCQDFCPHYTGQKSWQFFVRILGETMTS